MTTVEIIKKFGVEHYYDEAKTHYIVIPKAISITKEDAMRAANHYFKVNAANLAVWDARVMTSFSRRKWAQSPFGRWKRQNNVVIKGYGVSVALVTLTHAGKVRLHLALIWR